MSSPIVPRRYRVRGLDSCRQEMYRGFHEGKVRGSTTYISGVDKCWTWRLQEMNLWTGYMNEGKSIFLRQLALIKALMDGWVFLFAAPEDFPPEEFYDDLIHTLVGQSTDPTHPAQVSEDWYIRAADKIKDLIYFVDIDPGMTIADVLHAFEETMAEFHGNGAIVKSCVMDPLIKFARPKEMHERDDQYAQHITTITTSFARRKNISLHLVLHQLTPKKQENGNYPKPSPYAIKGGGTWSDGVDNVLTVWRPSYGSDKLDTEVRFASEKIKKQKLVGIPQEIRMRFNRKTNRYTEFDRERDLFEFDNVFQRLVLKDN
jgi:twinkle protein